MGSAGTWAPHRPQKRDPSRISASDNDTLRLAGGVGVLVAPSIGHIYTGDYARGVGMVFARGAGLGIMVAGAAMALDHCGLASSCESNGGNVLFYAGAAIGAGATLYSIIDAGFAARRANKRAREQLYVSAAPIVGPARSQGMGLVLSGRF